jgi:multiple sugar transport system permease protein
MGSSAPVRRRFASLRFMSLVKDLFVYTVLIIASIAFIFPLYWMASTSLKVEEHIMDVPPQVIPDPVDWANYPETVTAPGFDFPTLLKNTLTYGILETFGIVISCTLVAYSFARMRWPGRNLFFVLTLATMMVPSAVTLVPEFLIFRRLGWTGTMLPLIVPGFFGSAFNIFLLRQFFMTIPMELSEAAIVDGASHWKILTQIILPLAKPALATVTLFEFLFCWTDFMGPLIYLSREENFTL